MSAREALSEWTRAHVGEEHRPALSKLVAAFVAEAVRNDRAKVAADLAAKKRAADAVRKVNEMHAPDGGLGDIFGSMFGAKRP